MSYFFFPDLFYLTSFFPCAYDLDVMVKVENVVADIQALRTGLSELDPRFVCVGMKLYVSLASINVIVVP